MTEQEKSVLALIANSLNEIEESIGCNDVHTATIGIEQCRIYLDALTGALDELPEDLQQFAQQEAATHYPHSVFVMKIPPNTCLNCKVFEQEPDSLFCEFCMEEGSAS